MKTLKHLLDNNKQWSKEVTDNNPNFFSSLEKQQEPDYVWIGCSDSRVSATNIVGLMPGEIFVHRNIANLVIHTDMNCLSVLQYAVEVLKVTHIIICGHYGCGGVKSALENKRHGLIDNWLRHIQDVAHIHEDILSGITDKKEKVNKLCQLNVIEQVINAASTTIVQDAWAKKQKLRIHGWIYDLSNGIIDDMNIHLENNEELRELRNRSWK